MKKLLIFMMSLVMACCAFAACNGGGETSSSSDNSNSTNSGSSNSSSLAPGTYSITYYLVDEATGEVYNLEDYEALYEKNGNYPTAAAKGKVTISSLKTGEIDVEQVSDKYTKGMMFKGWYADEDLKNLLGKGQIEIDLTENTSIYGKVEVFAYLGPF